jgi:hypothetical protein
MKVFMLNWNRSAKNLPTWFKDEDIADIGTDQIKEILSTNNNVMFLNRSQAPSFLFDAGIEAVLCVDDKRFNQR